MAVYPVAAWLPVTGLDKDPVIIPVGVILHVDGGNASSLYEYFNGPSGGVESNLFVNKKGHWEQYRDTTRQADAQAAGNGWWANGKFYGYNSVESQGKCDGTGWNDIQFEELATFLAWHHKTHGTPLRQCRNAKDKGIGYHAQFESWNPNNHACPCPERIKQIPALIARAQQIVDGLDKIKMGTFIEPEGTMPGDGVYFVDERGVWPVNKPRWDFLVSKGVKVETIKRDVYTALVKWANPQRVPTKEEIATAVLDALPVAQTGGLTKEQVNEAVVEGLKHLGITVA
jgi:hypothetical protein